MQPSNFSSSGTTECVWAKTTVLRTEGDPEAHIDSEGCLWLVIGDCEASRMAVCIKGYLMGVIDAFDAQGRPLTLTEVSAHTWLPEGTTAATILDELMFG